jgi:hypothetical protein
MVLITDPLLNTANEKKIMGLITLLRRSTMPKKFQHQIEKKLDKLSQLLDNLTEAQIIDSNDSDT